MKATVIPVAPRAPRGSAQEQQLNRSSSRGSLQGPVGGRKRGGGGGVSRTPRGTANCARGERQAGA
eukprot:6236686-Pyramimonas_sp.AAC.1